MKIKLAVLALLMAINIGLQTVEKPRFLFPDAAALRSLDDLAKLPKEDAVKFLKDVDNLAQYFVDVREAGRLILYAALSL